METVHVANGSSLWWSDGDGHSYGSSSSSPVSSDIRAASCWVSACTISREFSMALSTFSSFAVREISSFKGLAEMVLEFLDSGLTKSSHMSLLKISYFITAPSITDVQTVSTTQVRVTLRGPSITSRIKHYEVESFGSICRIPKDASPLACTLGDLPSGAKNRIAARSCDTNGYCSSDTIGTGYTIPVGMQSYLTLPLLNKHTLRRLLWYLSSTGSRL